MEWNSAWSNKELKLTKPSIMELRSLTPVLDIDRPDAEMDSNLVVGVAGLLLSVLTYFAGVQRTKKQLSRQEKSTSQQNVLDRYLDFRKTGKTSGPDGLQRAGVATLDSDAEIRSVILRIVQHGEKHPLGANYQQFDSIDLKRFFEWTATTGVNFHAIRLEKLLERFQSDV